MGEVVSHTEIARFTGEGKAVDLIKSFCNLPFAVENIGAVQDIIPDLGSDRSSDDIDIVVFCERGEHFLRSFSVLVSKFVQMLRGKEADIPCLREHKDVRFVLHGLFHELQSVSVIDVGLSQLDMHLQQSDSKFHISSFSDEMQGKLNLIYIIAFLHDKKTAARAAVFNFTNFMQRMRCMRQPGKRYP